MDERADQMVLDYLRRVGDVAHSRLRADERLDFVTRLRRRIDEMRAEAGAVEPDETRQVIARFGEPSRLVERERRRLEQAREREQAASESAGLQDGRAASAEPSPDSEPSTQPIPVVRDSTGQPEPAEPPHASQPVQQQKPDQPPPNAAPWLRRRAPTSLPASGDTVERKPTTLGARLGGGTRPTREGPPTYETTGRTLPGTPGLGSTMSPTDIRALVNEHRVETAAIVLLGLGGLIVPFPYTLVPLAAGAACLALARAWIARDKLIGISAPVAGLLFGVFVVGTVTRSADVAVDVSAFAAAFTGHGATFVRVGALAGAGYLAFQLFRTAAGSGGPPPRGDTGG